ncbi:MAG: response regulator transcription factor, partial [Verrucomicrobiae bacterium]|nr:response regulator transcription factor [Verrucomicrobiae bacterium]
MPKAVPPDSSRRVRVGLVDDHLVVRLGLRALLETHPGIEVVGEAATGAEALELVVRRHPDVLLLDLRLPDLDGLEVCRRLKASESAPAVLVLSSFADDQTVLAAIEVGADGYLLKVAAGPDIPQTILTVASGGSVLDPQVARRVLQTFQKSKSTPPEAPSVLSRLNSQEMRVLASLAKG